MADSKSKRFLDTGDDELNALLTRGTEGNRQGIPLPGPGPIESSILVVKGDTGTGKTVFASNLAFNLHNTASGTGEGRILPFCVYFSFGQSAQSVRGIIDALRRDGGGGTGIPVYYPCIVTADLPALELAGQGLPLLRRLLVEALGPLSDPFAPDGGLPDFGSYVNHLKRVSGLDVAEEEVVGTDEAPKRLPVVFVDPINYFFDIADTRPTIADLFRLFRTWPWPFVVTLEDPAGAPNSVSAELARAVEFEADTILHLTYESTPYARRYVEVLKSRFAQPIFGRHTFRIDGPSHSLKDVWIIKSKSERSKTDDHASDAPDVRLKSIVNDQKVFRHPGVLIFRSIHWYNSRSWPRVPPSAHRDDVRPPRYHTGIVELDYALNGEPFALEAHDEPPTPLPLNSSLLVCGAKGGHKLAFAFNLLVAGLWDTRTRVEEDGDERVPESESALLVSFGEQGSADPRRVALADSLLSGNPECNSPKLGRLQEVDRRDSQAAKEVGPKLIVSKWAPEVETTGQKLIEAHFRPGYLGVDEFLWAMEGLVDGYRPSRVLIDSTAHLRTRFPGLYAEPMLFTALSGLVRSRGAMLITIDVTGKGHDKALSYGVAASADYVIELGRLRGKVVVLRDSGDWRERLRQRGVEDPERLNWAKMTLGNVRGKKYGRFAHAVGVVEASDGDIGSQLIMLPIEEADSPTFLSDRRRRAPVRRADSRVGRRGVSARV